MTSSQSLQSNESSQQRAVAASSNSNASSCSNGSDRGAWAGTNRPARVQNVRRRSYADWITRAIQSSSEQKMTLAGIYNWMAANVPGLYEKRNLHSSKGWKNAVRHTLSVNRRFQKSSQPNVRAALWSITPSGPEIDSSDAPRQSTTDPQLSAPSELPSCSSLFTSSIPVTTFATTAPYLRTSPTTSTGFASINTIGNCEPIQAPAPIVTQTLELHHQDGTVRTVTVPKPFPIHVVGDYRLVTVDPKLHMPHVVTSG